MVKEKDSPVSVTTLISQQSNLHYNFKTIHLKTVCFVDRSKVPPTLLFMNKEQKWQAQRFATNTWNQFFWCFCFLAVSLHRSLTLPWQTDVIISNTALWICHQEGCLPLMRLLWRMLTYQQDWTCHESPYCAMRVADSCTCTSGGSLILFEKVVVNHVGGDREMDWFYI